MSAEAEEWIWGNHRGGGGAPVRNTHGEQVANLRTVVKGSPHKRQSLDQHQEGGGRYHSPIKGLETHYSSPQQASPVRLGHRNINIDDSEREIKARKAREYQEQLREQVEAKKRQKEAEKREKDRDKQKELDEYMTNHYRGPPPQGGQVSPRRVVKDDFSPRGERRNNGKRENLHMENGQPNDWDRSGRRDREGGGWRRQESGSPRGRKDTDGERGGREDRRRDGATRHEEYVDSRERDYRDRSSQDREERDRDRGEWVSKAEYDELSAICRKLMEQQADLTSQLQLQAEIIEDLRSGAAPVAGRAVKEKDTARSTKQNAGGGVAFGRRNGARAAGGRASKQQSDVSGTDALRSQSVHQKLPGTRRAAGAGVKLPAVDRRPSSMHEAPRAPAGGAPAATGRRGLKALSGATKKGGSSPVEPPAAKSGVSGFKKLQMGISKPAGGPVIVSYEDEEPTVVQRRPVKERTQGGRSQLPVATNSKLRESNNELVGASEHLYMGSAESDGISNDQLDRLLYQVRGARN